MKNVLTAAAAVALTVVVATTDFTPPQPMREVSLDKFQAIWTPVVSTDCETWEIRQRDTALEDIWPEHVDYMTINSGQTRYASDDTARLPFHGDETFKFGFYKDGRQVYYVNLEASSTCF